jgi:putative nucleotidyltransferase with HDIG domain
MERLLPKVLVVDDEPEIRAYLTQALRPSASLVASAADAQDGLQQIEAADFDVVVCDMHLPRANGLELLSIAREAQWDIGFILITGKPELPQVLSAMRLEVSDFLLKPFGARDLRLSLLRAYQRLLDRRHDRLQRQRLESSIQRRTRELEAALAGLESNYVSTLQALVAALDAREHETCAHSFRVRAYTLHLAGLAGYPAAMLRALEHAALLHDIGKVALSDAVLLKPGRLTEEEWLEMKKHPGIGEQILRRVSFPQPAAAIVRQHHERYDGSGYPDGLAGEHISLGARIFAFADTLDAMTSDRSYRQAPGLEAARAEISRCAGSQFDPQLAEIFLHVPDTIWPELRRHVERSYRQEAALHADSRC